MTIRGDIRSNSGIGSAPPRRGIVRGSLNRRLFFALDSKKAGDHPALMQFIWVAASTALPVVDRQALGL
jgi:hypothetical protein